MDFPPPAYSKSASVSRSSSERDGLRAMADALLRGPLPRNVSLSSSASTSSPLLSNTSVTSASVSRSEALLHSPVPRSVSSPASPAASSASISRSSASRHGMAATAEALLRSPIPSSVSSFNPSVASSASVSRSSASRHGMAATAEALLRSPVPSSVSSFNFSEASASVPRSNVSQSGRSPASRSVSSPLLPTASASMSSSSVSRSGVRATVDTKKGFSVPPSASSSVSSSSTWTSSVSSLPPSYRASQQSARPRPPIVGSASKSAPILPVRSRSSRTEDSSPTSISAAESKRRVRQMQSAVEKASAAAPSRNTEGLFKAVCSTDLLFLMDTTSSMKKYINAAKDQVRSIMTEIQGAFLGESIVRVAVVGYKDHCNTPNVEFLDFTTSMDQARDFLGSLKASGGEGYTADALGGIRQASNATWMQNTRCVIHIADAPAHSRALHDMSESHDPKYYRPGSEPHGLKYDAVIQMLVKLGVNYHFLHVHPCTDRMVMAFSRVYNAAGADSQLLPTNRYYEKTDARSSSNYGGSSKQASKYGTNDSPQLLFQELPIGIEAGSLQRLVLKSVTDSVTRASSRHSLVLGRSKLSPGAARHPYRSTSQHPPILSVVREDESEAVEVRLEKDPPQWNLSGWLDMKLESEGYIPEVVVYSGSTLADMMDSDDNIKLSVAQLTVHARSIPFGQGASRLASYARIAASASRFVVKSFTSGGKGLESLIEDMRMQALCKAFALEFNGLVRQDQWIDFVVTACLQKSTDGTPGGGGCLSLEPFLPGDYVKYNNNGMFVKEDTPNDPTNRVAQAFSHFTFERSYGHFMVVDLQGVGNMLTDPAIHTKDPTRFKLNDVNCSTDGFQFFFVKHECNDVCRQLGLVSHRGMAELGDWQFRQQWPPLDPTVCCSNKFCQGIMPLQRANTSPKFPAYRWCTVCWPELQASTVQWICIAPGDVHKFDVCKFFYVSQGKLPPRKCPDHTEKDMTVSSAASIGGSLWSRKKAGLSKGAIYGNEY